MPVPALVVLPMMSSARIALVTIFECLEVSPVRISNGILLYNINKVVEFTEFGMGAVTRFGQLSLVVIFVWVKYPVN
jgi:hypothetical protein